MSVHIFVTASCTISTTIGEKLLVPIVIR